MYGSLEVGIKSNILIVNLFYNFKSPEHGLQHKKLIHKQDIKLIKKNHSNV